ncbi:MAG: VCBS repeat-containing protein [Bacteroidales bacterium]|nr:VCBS repeat-containing protein [Bacteroidales bacterium]
MKTKITTSWNSFPSSIMKAAGVFSFLLISLVTIPLTAICDHYESGLNRVTVDAPSMEGDTVFGSFTEITPNDPLFITPADEDFWVNATAPADFDNDGDLDIAVIGYYVIYNVGAEYKLVLMRNEGQAGMNEWDFSYVDVPMGSMSSGSSDLAWGDADGDGDLDLVAGSNDLTFLFLNDSGTLVQSNTTLPGYWEENSQAEFDLRSMSWADFDNDGDQDLLIPSVYDAQSFSFRTALMRNDGLDSNGDLLFTETGPVLDPTNHAQTAWADVDADQDLDLFVVNIAPLFDNSYIRRYLNQGDGTFLAEEILGSVAVTYGEAQWGDYDGDGDLDILLAGGVNEANGSYTHMVIRIYTNENGTYVPFEAVSNLEADGWFDISAATWADYDSDGDMDILVAGNYNSGTNIEGRARIYSNNNGIFTDSGTELPAPRASGDLGGTFSWLDMDGDGDLDYYIAGQYFVPGGNGLVESQMHLYRNDAQIINLPPAAPGGLQSEITAGHTVRLSWEPVIDDHTPTASLTYDLELYKDNTPVVIPERMPQPGTLSAVNEWVVEGLPDGNYQWIVRAVDAAFAGSETVVGSFSIGLTTELQEVMASRISLGQNVPNPASERTKIPFTLPTQAYVTIHVYGALGQIVAVPLNHTFMQAGSHEISLDTGNLPEGVYYYRLEGFDEARKMVVKKR